MNRFNNIFLITSAGLLGIFLGTCLYFAVYSLVLHKPLPSVAMGRTEQGVRVTVTLP